MPATGRAYWQGYLRLSLVSIAVELFNAEDRKSNIGFHQIHKPSGKRIHYTKTVEGKGEVDSDDIVSGYEVEDDTYIIMEPDEIDAVRLESKKTIELIQFVALDAHTRKNDDLAFVLGGGRRAFATVAARSEAQDRAHAGVLCLETRLERLGSTRTPTYQTGQFRRRQG